MKKKPLFHWAWIILAICFVNIFINYSIQLGYGVVLPEMIRDLNFSRTAGGTIFNAYFFVYILSTPLAGILTDQLGARRVISSCAFILSVGVLLMGMVDSLWLACLAFAIAGLGSAGMWVPVTAVVQRWFVLHKRGLALAILSSGYGLGFAIMGLVFPWIVQNFSWRHAWYMLSAAALVLIILNSLLLRNNPESVKWQPWGYNTRTKPSQFKTSQFKDISLSLIFKNPVFWLIGVSYLFVTMSYFGSTTFMVDYAGYQLGFPLAKASFLAVIHGSGQTCGVLIVLPLSDYFGRKKTIMISNAFISLCLIGFILSGNSWIILCAVVGALAFFLGTMFPLYSACAGDYFPQEIIGTVLGMWTVFLGIGAISIHWISGFLRDTTGSYHIAFVISALAAAISIVLMWFVKKPINI